MRKDIYNYRSL